MAGGLCAGWAEWQGRGGIKDLVSVSLDSDLEVIKDQKKFLRREMT